MTGPTLKASEYDCMRRGGRSQDALFHRSCDVSLL